MSKSLGFDHEEPKVGTVVYQHYAPQRLGRVIKVRTDNNQYLPFHCTVHWASGKITEHPAHYLADFLALVADHQKKLRNHQKRLVDFNKAVPA